MHEGVFKFLLQCLCVLGKKINALFIIVFQKLDDEDGLPEFDGAHISEVVSQKVFFNHLVDFGFIFGRVVAKGKQEQETTFENGNNEPVVHTDFVHFYLVDQRFVAENELNHLSLDVEVRH